MQINNMVARETIKAPASKVWRIVGREFADIDRWSSGITQSAGLQDGPPLGSCEISGRSCDTVQERLTYFDDESMRFGYVMIDPPFFIKTIGNNWQIKEDGANQSVVEFRPTIEFSSFWGILFVPLTRIWGPWMARRVLEELKHYVEYDEPHPRKQKALKTAKSKTHSPY